MMTNEYHRETSDDLLLSKLRQAIEQVANFSIHTPNDFVQLSALIFKQQHATVSVSTLKRLWGYAGQDFHPRPFTLDVLARFVGHKDFSSFKTTLHKEQQQQSQLFIANTLTSSMLSVNDLVLLTWLPDRRCVVEHQGNGKFRVIEARNTKLSVGDTFECHLFINHEPLYIDRLIHNGMPPMSYVAGQKDGITARKLPNNYITNCTSLKA